MLATTCLIAALWAETKNQDYGAMSGVKSVIEHRMRLTHSSACQVIKAKGQFPWAKRGVNLPRPVSKLDRAALSRIKRVILRKSLHHKYRYFNNIWLGKRFPSKNRAVIIGSLMFY